MFTRAYGRPDSGHGDVVSLVNAQEQFIEEEARKLKKRSWSNQFNFNDLSPQIQQIKDG